MARNRIVIACAGLVCVLGTVVLSAYATLLAWLDTCDGDGGYPYSAPGSTAGRFCDSSVAAPYFLVELVAPVLVALGFGAWGSIRRSLVLVAVGLGAALLSVVVLAGVVLALPDSCSEEQQSADPSACETY